MSYPPQLVYITGDVHAGAPTPPTRRPSPDHRRPPHAARRAREPRPPRASAPTGCPTPPLAAACRPAGKSTLARELASQLETYKIFNAPAPLDHSARGDGLVEAYGRALRHHFKQVQQALRAAAEGHGVLMDGAMHETLARVDLDLRRGLLSPAAHARLAAFGGALLALAPNPHVVVSLEAAAAACAERGGRSPYTLDELAQLSSSLRVAAGSYAAKGASVYRREWTSYGKVAAIRDAILCAPPRFGWSASLAPPSDEAVDRLLEDAWAAAREPAEAAASAGGEAGEAEGVVAMAGSLESLDITPASSPAWHKGGKTRDEGASPTTIFAANFELAEPASPSCVTPKGAKAPVSYAADPASLAAIARPAAPASG